MYQNFKLDIFRKIRQLRLKCTRIDDKGVTLLLDGNKNYESNEKYNAERQAM